MVRGKRKYSLSYLLQSYYVEKKKYKNRVIQKSVAARKNLFLAATKLFVKNCKAILSPKALPPAIAVNTF